ncbi:MAG: helix-turn-helix transcriptional regulator [Clostridia bacterium]|nr:helix-turn-helix transcriptional regulator [Clostridia bacterium]
MLFEKDIVISKVALAMFVPPGSAKKNHPDRPNSGFAFYEAGESRYVFAGGKALNVRAGEAIFLPEGSFYRVEPSSGVCYAINFETAEPLSAAPQIIKPRNKAGALRLFKSAAAVWREKKPGYKYKCASLLYEFLSGLKAEEALGYENSRQALIIAPGVDAIHREYAGGMTVAKAAEKCGVSPEYFRALFKKEFGVSPLKYIDRLRLERASELLREGMCTVSDAAELSGFSDVSSFSRAFRRFFGVSPAEARKKKSF